MINPRGQMYHKSHTQPDDSCCMCIIKLLVVNWTVFTCCLDLPLPGVKDTTMKETIIVVNNNMCTAWYYGLE